MGLRKTAKRWGFSLLAQDSPIAAQNSLSWFFPAGNLDGDSVPHSHGTHKILDFGYLAPHECVRSRTPTAYRELLCNYKMQEDYAMARPKKEKSLHRGKRVYIRFTELQTVCANVDNILGTEREARREQQQSRKNEHSL